MKALLDEGTFVLSDLLQSGAGSCHPETGERLRKLARDWEASGLHTGAGLLEDIAQALEARRHGGTPDPTGLMERVWTAVRYTQLCRQKYCLDAAGRRLCQTGPERDKEEEQ